MHMGKKKQKVADEAPIPTTDETTTEVQPEEPVEAPAEPAPAEEEKPKKRRKQKVTAMSATATLADLSAAYLQNMETEGKSSGTISSYSMELRVAMDELGEATPIAEITPEKVGEFFNSKR